MSVFRYLAWETESIEDMEDLIKREEGVGIRFYPYYNRFFISEGNEWIIYKAYVNGSHEREAFYAYHCKTLNTEFGDSLWRI